MLNAWYLTVLLH